jgi:FkbM family methyltransferase
MKAKATLVLLLSALVLLWAVPRIFLSGDRRTQVYFSAFQGLYLHSPSLVRTFLLMQDSLLLPPVRRLESFEPAWTQTGPGTKMLLDPYDMVSLRILETGQWEPESGRAVAGHLSPGATFIDVGAHIGYYSLQASRVVGASGHILAIEPNPQTLPKLRDNIAANNDRTISVWPVACAESESTLQLYAAPRGNTGESSLSKENASHAGAPSAVYSVAARPLDAIVAEANLSRVDVIKIDVEGAEFQVLKGAAQTIARYHPVLIIELVPDQLKAMGATVEEVAAFLGAHGYRASPLMDEANFQFVSVAAAARAQ